MDRHTVEPREGFQAIIEEQGLVYWPTIRDDGTKFSYWHEEAHYSFTSGEVYELEAAVRLLMEQLVEAGDFIIEENLFARMGIPGWAVPRIKETWMQEPPMLYGRFDFAYGPDGLKLLEYNADTPTALLESAVIQWEWGKDVFGSGFDQWNLLHESLVARWKEMAAAKRLPGELLHFLFAGDEDSGEDFMTTAYLAETARQAGLASELLPIKRLGTSPGRGFVDAAQRQVRTAFKLWPWEWIVHERFAREVLDRMGSGANSTLWIEPIWKMLWSNKGILPVLHYLFPESDVILPAWWADDFDPSRCRSFVRKPLLAREGADTTVVLNGDVAEEGPSQDYGEEGFVVQQFAPLDNGYGANPVLGVWTVDMEPVGCGIRESDGLITNNLSRFVPHAIAG